MHAKKGKKAKYLARFFHALKIAVLFMIAAVLLPILTWAEKRGEKTFFLTREK